MVVKSTKKKTTKKITKREPSPSMLIKKIATISDSNKVLQKEIKVMSKIFGENQKVLISMKGNDRHTSFNIRTYTKTIKTN